MDFDNWFADGVPPEVKKMADQYAAEHNGMYPDCYATIDYENMSLNQFIKFLKKALRRHCSIEDVIS